ncbi:hypothetical protein SBA2_670110 [Acidobacteriia bacterium SbA2]|nr:hypothetical protein SBA2_670110 [Acidobacteriia bacterium SbA2]
MWVFRYELSGARLRENATAGIETALDERAICLIHIANRAGACGGVPLRVMVRRAK